MPETLYTFNNKTLTAIKKVKESDIIVSVGAERINDNFYKAILFSLYMLWMVKSYNKFLILFPQTIGPFHFRLTRYLSKIVLNKCDVIYLRDRKSNETLEDLGVTKPVIVDTCDVAVLQDAISEKNSWRLLNQYGLKKEAQPLLGMSVMQWDYIKAQGESGYDDYKKAIATVADQYIEEKGVQILFIATNVLTEGCREDDLATAKEIADLMRNKKGLTILERLYTPSELKGIMGLLELCLVTRMHACIFSTGIFTPTVSINYQFKLREYMKLVGLGDYTVDIDMVSTENVKDIIDRGWKDRASHRKILEDKINYWRNNLEGSMSQLPFLYAQHQ
ncbi:hypothetical protein DSCOOX_60560 [Desulfosarcina ovata subsp. ovata]|uniref:Polysaccharide pyruvyl transferase domain-containing protein n=1 Tax=Desulfosarcina ovata subsp. ovata TaxID=2752305 RepID=A0A5K8AK47_9BACT|nr:hypothetical protein DSCOOX_60560 [Desulfosarcina ovata subsp. ovata]